MAGLYPDPPSWRMALDKDGAVFVFINSANVITQLTSGQVTSLCDEGASEFNDGNQYQAFAVIFPELRDVDGYFFAGNLDPNFSDGVIEVSGNTTNGVDGTWTQIGTMLKAAFNQVVSPNYRSGIQSTSQLNVRGVRFRSSTSTIQRFRAFHLYGEPIPGANPNRLDLWHATLDQRIAPAYLDWGDTPRSSSADRTFRVKNRSSTLTANSVRVAQDVLTDATPSVPGQHTLSMDGGTTFLPQVNIGNLAPGAISTQVLILRRNTPSNAQLGAWTHRVFAEANSWS